MASDNKIGSYNSILISSAYSSLTMHSYFQKPRNILIQNFSLSLQLPTPMIPSIKAEEYKTTRITLVQVKKSLSDRKHE